MFFLRALRQPSLCSACSTTRAYATGAALAPTSSKKGAPKAAPIQSSCPADTILTGVNYLKGQPPVLAQVDEEYPDWLWTILQPKVWPDDGPGGKYERVQRRNANRQAIKDRNFMQTQ